MSPTEEPVQTQTNPASAAHVPRQTAPVMDVTPPPAVETPVNTPTATTVSDPVADTTFIETPIANQPSDMHAPPNEDEPPTEAEPSTDAAPSQAESSSSQSEAVGKEIKRAHDASSLAQEQAAKKPAKQGNNSVTVAIMATVVIVLGLAVLAVLAYKSSK